MKKPFLILALCLSTINTPAKPFGHYVHKDYNDTLKVTGILVIHYDKAYHITFVDYNGKTLEKWIEGTISYPDKKLCIKSDKYYCNNVKIYNDSLLLNDKLYKRVD